MTIPAIETGPVSQRVISEEIEKIHAGAHAFLIQPGGVVVRDLFGIDFGTLTTLLDVPLTDGTKKAAS